jgi:hypothetical protein
LIDKTYRLTGGKEFRSLILKQAGRLTTIFFKEEEMKTKICLALSTLIITSLIAPPIMGMGQEKAQGESQVTKSEARHEHMKEVTAGRIRAREEYRAAKHSQVSLPSTGNVQ